MANGTGEGSKAPSWVVPVLVSAAMFVFGVLQVMSNTQIHNLNNRISELRSDLREYSRRVDRHIENNRIHTPRDTSS